MGKLLKDFGYDIIKHALRFVQESSKAEPLTSLCAYVSSEAFALVLVLEVQMDLRLYFCQAPCNDTYASRIIL